MAVKRPNVELHIEELILHGLRPADRHAIAQGLETELTRLLFERGLPGSLARGADLPTTGSSSFEATPDSVPHALGIRIAESVYRGLER